MVAVANEIIAGICEEWKTYETSLEQHFISVVSYMLRRQPIW